MVNFNEEVLVVDFDASDLRSTRNSALGECKFYRIPLKDEKTEDYRITCQPNSRSTFEDFEDVVNVFVVIFQILQSIMDNL